MKVSGTYILNAPRERVWELLNDPALLKACLPGCESMETIGPDQFQAVLTIGIAAVKGKYTGSVTLLEKEPPRQLTMRIEGKGSGGFMQGTGQLELADDPQGTKVTYQGDIQVGGPIASVGQRLLDGAAKMIVGQFFTAVNAQLAAMSSPPSPPAGTAGEAGNTAPRDATHFLTGAPVQLSSSRTLLQFLTTQLRDKLQQWFRRPA